MTPHIARRFRTASRPLGALAAVVSLVLSSFLLGTGPAAAAETPTTGFTRGFTAPNGLSSTYNLYADGIDRSKPVGVAFYFDGDGQYWAQRPTGSVVRDMARHAAARNMVLVVPLSPDRTGSRTWWENIDANGDWFRALSGHLVQRYGLDTNRVWLTGYSGGAEFITMEVLADRQNWIRGGGAVVIGGGGARKMQTAPSAAVKSLPIQWVTGADDVAGATQPATWSALASARRGQQSYAAQGFTRTSLQVPAGVNHHEYDQAALLDAALRTYGSASVPAPAPVVPGPFTDVPATHTFAPEITWVKNRAVLRGWPDGTYRPTHQMTREQVAAALYRLAGSPTYTPPRTSPFTDVPTSHVFYKEIAWLHAKGISTGWAAADGTRTYKPAQRVSRDQMAAFFYRQAGKPAYTPPRTSPFVDVSTGQGFYKEMAWLQATGISTGWKDGTYRPGAGTSRDVMAAFLHRYAENS
ncbi:S-layer homology domain-containing protein [Kocuria oceani]|uniref:S-layer homology domain-containing protein n=1 Tax=Kocuria oceani TaxID=988827 RepID=UPI0024063626|nr:S-layer homology domain-containing protein [Kocuria oceani]